MRQVAALGLKLRWRRKGCSLIGQVACTCGNKVTARPRVSSTVVIPVLSGRLATSPGSSRKDFEVRLLNLYCKVRTIVAPCRVSGHFCGLGTLCYCAVLNAIYIYTYCANVANLTYDHRSVKTRHPVQNLVLSISVGVVGTEF